MNRFTQKRFRLSGVAILSAFLMLGSSAHSEALNLGAKAKYIISIDPAARAAVEKAITGAGGKINTKYNDELPSWLESHFLFARWTKWKKKFGEVILIEG